MAMLLYGDLWHAHGQHGLANGIVNKFIFYLSRNSEYFIHPIWDIAALLHGLVHDFLLLFNY